LSQVTENLHLLALIITVFGVTLAVIVTFDTCVPEPFTSIFTTLWFSRYCAEWYSTAQMMIKIDLLS